MCVCVCVCMCMYVLLSAYNVSPASLSRRPRSGISYPSLFAGFYSEILLEIMSGIFSEIYRRKNQVIFSEIKSEMNIGDFIGD